MQRPFLVGCLLLLVLPACAATPRTEPLTADSLWHWTWAGDVRLSPDASRLVYVRTEVDRSADDYRSDLWIHDLESGEHRPLTTHQADDRSPRWSPDGKRIAFLSSRRGGNQLWVIEVDGGEARQLTGLEGGAGTPVWSPRGDRIAFASRALTAEERQQQSEREQARKQAEREARGLSAEAAMEQSPEAVVIDRLRYQADGRPGYLPEAHRHIWVVSADDAKPWPAEPRRLTHGDYEHGAPIWSADGKQLYFSALLEADAEWRLGESHLYRLSLSGEAAPVQLSEGRRSRGRPQLSPDGRWLAYTGNEHEEPAPSYRPSDLYVMPAEGGEERLLTGNYDRGVADGTSGDMRSPAAAGRQWAWAADSESLWFTTAVEGQTHLAEVDIEGEGVDRRTAFEAGDVREFSLAGERLALIWANPERPADIHVMGPDQAAEQSQWRQLTELNKSLLAGRTLSDYETVWYESFDGRQIQAWVIRPGDFDPDHRYPALLYIHGGPHAMYGTTFFHEFQTLADAGYVVFITNPRGSTGYGADFGNIIQYRYPGDDFRDLMAGVDWLVAQGEVDEDRLGIAGGSGGGLLTTWAVTQTNRFKAAAAQRSVTNWHSFVGTADLNHYFVQRWFPAPPWEEALHYIERSPLAHVDQVETPILLIHSEQDWRTPLEQTRQFYTQLRMQDKPARMVIFPQASHGLSRAGRPGQRIERLRHIRDWFDEHLKD